MPIRRQELIQWFGGKCEKCGSIEKLQFAHIEETELSKKKGRGRKERFYDVLKNPEKYRLYCEECHEQYDAGELKSEEN
jgi:ERCC4-type nuclease